MWRSVLSARLPSLGPSEANETLSEERSGESELSSTPLVLAALAAVVALTLVSGFLSIFVIIFGAGIGFVIGMGISAVRKKMSAKNDTEDEELREEELVL